MTMKPDERRSYSSLSPALQAQDGAWRRDVEMRQRRIEAEQRDLRTHVAHAERLADEALEKSEVPTAQVWHAPDFEMPHQQTTHPRPQIPAMDWPTAVAISSLFVTLFALAAIVLIFIAVVSVKP